jgi:excisionase family DNA binding protein
MPDHADTTAVSFAVPDGLLDTLADAIAERLARRPPAPGEGTASPWMDFEAARAYLGFSRDALYKLTAAAAIPFRRKTGGQRLRFHRGELDAWMDEAYPRVDRLA